MFFKMWVKSKFVVRQTSYYNLLTLRNAKKSYVFEAFIILKTYCYFQSQEILFKYHLQVIYLWDFYQVKFNSFSGRPKNIFGIFLIEHNAGDIENKNIAGA